VHLPTGWRTLEPHFPLSLPTSWHTSLAARGTAERAMRCLLRRPVRVRGSRQVGSQACHAPGNASLTHYWRPIQTIQLHAWTVTRYVVSDRDEVSIRWGRGLPRKKKEEKKRKKGWFLGSGPVACGHLNTGHVGSMHANFLTICSIITASPCSHVFNLLGTIKVRLARIIGPASALVP